MHRSLTHANFMPSAFTRRFFMHFAHSQAYKKWWLQQMAILFIAAFILIFIYPKTNLDALLIAPYFDVAQHQFMLKHHWFFENVMHTALKNLMLLIALSVLTLWLFSYKINQLKQYRRSLIWTFIAMLLATTTITIVKHFSNHACPWDLTMYGGNQPLLALFDTLPPGAEAGQCFPGGHASGGFALWAFYFAFKKINPSLAQLGLYSGLVFGFVMGWAQMMRGAHFLSHNLWTAWFVWLVLCLLAAIWPPTKCASLILNQHQ